jgi:hypothetical protein
VVQPFYAHIPNVHRRAFAHCLQSFQNLYVAGGIIRWRGAFQFTHNGYLQTIKNSGFMRYFRIEILKKRIGKIDFTDLLFSPRHQPASHSGTIAKHAKNDLFRGCFFSSREATGSNLRRLEQKQFHAGLQAALAGDWKDKNTSRILSVG